jgi:hypothetical protein
MDITRNDTFDTVDLIQYRDELADDVIQAFNDFYYDEIEAGEIEELEDIEDIDLEDDDYSAFYDDCQNARDYVLLNDFCEELEKYAPDFRYGETVIREDHFEDYARELSEEITPGLEELPDYIKRNIDWDGVADDIRVDYEEVLYEGEYFLIRSV